MTYAEFETVCAHERLRIEEKPYLFDEYLSGRERLKSFSTPV
jgi:hypothetical protein